MTVLETHRLSAVVATVAVDDQGAALGFGVLRRGWAPVGLALQANPQRSLGSFLAGRPPYELAQLAVDPSHHGKGFGTLIHDELVSHACDEPILMVTRAEAGATIRLCESRGWQRIGEIGAGTQRVVWGRNIAILDPTDTRLMNRPPYGSLMRDRDADLVLCHICWRWFRALGAHLRSHSITAREYRLVFGLPLSKPLRNQTRRSSPIDAAMVSSAPCRINPDPLSSAVPVGRATSLRW